MPECSYRSLGRFSSLIHGGSFRNGLIIESVSLVTVLERRSFLILTAANLISAAFASSAFAKDSGSDGGGGEGGEGGDGEGSGKGGSDDGGGSDDSGDHDDNSGSGSGRDNDDDSEGNDQRAARDAVKNGNAASLRDILKSVRRRYSGDVVDIKLRHKGGNYTYRIKMLSSEGRVYSLIVDAGTKKVLRISKD